MNKNFLRLTQNFQKFIWTAIIILCAYILLKGSFVFAPADIRQTVQSFYEALITDVSQNIIWNHSPLMQYVSRLEEGEGSSYDDVIVNAVSNFFVFNQYAEFMENSVDENALYNIYLAANNQLKVGSRYSGGIMSDGSSGSILNQNSLPNHLNLNEIGFIEGESYYEDETTNNSEDSAEALVQNSKKITTLIEQKDLGYLIKNFYTVDSSTAVSSSVFQIKNLLNNDMTIRQDNSKPQILLFHTHSKEAFADSRSSKKEDSIVGIGDYLEDILTNQYGYHVIHDSSTYDTVRDRAYGVALPATQKILKDNPSIEVVIDLHRDGVGAKGTKRVTEIDGKETAQIMFFNGLSRNNKGPIEYLENKNLEGNLSFSLQMQLKAMTLYPNFARKIYLKNYRFNMHQKPKYLLIELGNEHNTVSEARNAMEPLAKILDEVLQGK